MVCLFLSILFATMCYETVQIGRRYPLLNFKPLILKFGLAKTQVILII